MLGPYFKEEIVKLWMINVTVGTITIYVQTTLSILLLVISIGYTLWKWNEDVWKKKETSDLEKEIDEIRDRKVHEK
jgi:hypothetical protein